jgi:hypothetical protein
MPVIIGFMLNNKKQVGSSENGVLLYLSMNHELFITIMLCYVLVVP